MIQTIVRALIVAFVFATLLQSIAFAQEDKNEVGLVIGGMVFRAAKLRCKSQQQYAKQPGIYRWFVDSISDGRFIDFPRGVNFD